MTATKSSEPESASNVSMRPQIESADLNDVGSDAESYRPLKKELTVLLAGDKGSGKTCFMSMVLNLLEQRGPLELDNHGDARFEQPHQTGRTHTTYASAYSVATSTGQKVRLIDTPAFAIVTGGMVDYIAHESIYREIEKSASGIDALLIFVDGTLNKLPIITQYTLSVIATLMPHSVLANTAFIFTNCDSSNKRLGMDVLPSLWRGCSSWAIQNPLLWCKRYHELGTEANKRHQASQKRKLEAIYEDAALMLDELLEWTDQQTTHSIQGILDLYKIWIDIKSHIKCILSTSDDYDRESGLQPQPNLKAEAQAAWNNIQEEMELIQTHIHQTRSYTQSLAQTFNDIALCGNFTEHIQLALKVLATQKNDKLINFEDGTNHEVETVEGCIQTLNKSLKILDDEEGGECVVPGLNSEKSALQPLRRKRQLTILLIGETGCGKTAFMSLLVNLFQGYGPFELEDENDVDKESGLGKQESQTTEATLYTVKSPDGSIIQILDTPGLADTRGIDQDNKHKAKINQAIQEFVTTIDAVIIMANGTTERMPAATNYTLSTLTSMFPHSIINNIGFIFTHCELLTKNLNMGALPEELRGARNWTLENPLAFNKNYQREKDAGGNEALLEEGRQRLLTIYKNTVETLNDWLNWVDERDPQPTNEINRLYQTLVEIESKIDAAIALMTRLSEQRNKWEGIKCDLNDKKKLKEALQELKEQKIEYWDRESTQKHNTLCIVADCHSNCHEGCNVTFTLDPTQLGRQCLAFPRSTYDSGDSEAMASVCQFCGHKAGDHRHFNDLHVKKEKELDPTAKLKLETAETEEQTLEVAKGLVQAELNKIEEDLRSLYKQIQLQVDGYNNISLNKNFAGHINSAIHMLELRLEELKSKTNTEQEQKIVKDAIQKLRKKLEVLSNTGGDREGKGTSRVWVRCGKKCV
ncbi:hypothetical protein OPQ81_008584 [Rhizoctonia solani]|nr:hypothetical protein OPQ81_008584 [Rhizoctonia solani]